MMNISNDSYIILISYQPFKRLDSDFILLLTIDESNRLMVVAFIQRFYAARRT